MQLALEAASQTASTPGANTQIAHPALAGPAGLARSPIDRVTGGLVAEHDLADELRDAVAQLDGAPHLLAVGHARRTPTAPSVAGIVVGSVLDVPCSGQYELYLVYDLSDTEDDPRPQLQQTLLLGGLALVAAHRRRHLRRRAARRRPGAHGGRDQREARRRAARGAHPGEGRRRHRDPRPLVQRHGRQPAAADHPAGRALAGAAALRLRRLARAAHAAHDHPPGRRRALRPARRPSRRRPRAPPSCCTPRSSASSCCSPTCSR